MVSLIDLKVMETRNDCEIACDCVKRANVVLHVGLCKEIFARKHTATHRPTSAQPHNYSDHDDTHTYIDTSNKSASRGAHSYPQADICSAPYSDHNDIHLRRSLVAVEPRKLPMTGVGTETTFRLHQRKHFQNK